MKYIITQSSNTFNKYNYEIHSLNDIYMSTKRENTNQGGVILCPLPQSPPEMLRAVDGGVDGLPKLLEDEYSSNPDYRQI
jgi:hypothetical protein